MYNIIILYIYYILYKYYIFVFWSHSKKNKKTVFILLTLTLASLLVGDENCEYFEHIFELIPVLVLTPQLVASSRLQSDRPIASTSRPSTTNMEPRSSSLELLCSLLSGAT